MGELSALFHLTIAPLEIVVRGTAVYWFVFVLFRFVLRRDTGSVAIADIMLLVLIADAAQNAMAGAYKSLADGALLVSTLAGWNYLLDWASFRFPSFHRLLQPAALLLVSDGKLIRANLRRELVTMDELEAAMHAQGIDDIGKVKAARMESDGRITVVAAG